MALLKQIDNLGATVCWSPFKESKSLLAVGSKGSNSFDDEGGEMLLLDVSTRTYFFYFLISHSHQ